MSLSIIDALQVYILTTVRKKSHQQFFKKAYLLKPCALLLGHLDLGINSIIETLNSKEYALQKIAKNIFGELYVFLINNR